MLHDTSKALIPHPTEFKAPPPAQQASNLYGKITPQARVVLQHMRSTRDGSITMREAMADHSVQSLTKRISELKDAGYEILTDFCFNPVTKQRYARYFLITK